MKNFKAILFAALLAVFSSQVSASRLFYDCDPNSPFDNPYCPNAQKEDCCVLSPWGGNCGDRPICPDYTK